MVDPYENKGWNTLQQLIVGGVTRFEETRCGERTSELMSFAQKRYCRALYQAVLAAGPDVMNANE